MKKHRILFLLVDLNNSSVLCIENNQGLFIIPEYPELVDENVGFDNPQHFNDCFEKMTGVKVFRRYSFTFDYSCVFVLEETSQEHFHLNNCVWKSVQAFSNDEIVDGILTSTIKNYNQSKNMPWVNEEGFKPYLDWTYKTLKKHNIKTTGVIKQIKNAYVSNVFKFATNQGNVFLKIPGKLFIRELSITEELMSWHILKLPTWIDSNAEMNAILMKDMGGNNLCLDADLNTLTAIISEYANIQKKALCNLDIDNTNFHDYRLDNIGDGLNEISLQVKSLFDSFKNEISDHDIKSLRIKIDKALVKLACLKRLSIPTSIDHGDLRPGNIRVNNQGIVIYDWSFSTITNPLFGLSQLLHVMRKRITKDQKKHLIDMYLIQWADYGDIESWKEAYSIIEELKMFFFLYADYHWLKEIMSSVDDYLDEKSADGWLLKRRFHYFKGVLSSIISGS